MHQSEKTSRSCPEAALTACCADMKLPSLQTGVLKHKEFDWTTTWSDAGKTCAIPPLQNRRARQFDKIVDHYIKSKTIQRPDQHELYNTLERSLKKISFMFEASPITSICFPKTETHISNTCACRFVPSSIARSFPKASYFGTSSPLGP